MRRRRPALAAVRAAALGGGFPLAARLAWGVRRSDDPPFEAWLGQVDFFGERRHGLGFLVPKLLPLMPQSNAMAGRLKGLLRHRLATNNVRAAVISPAVSALAELGQVTVSGGWSDVATGTFLMQDAALSVTELGVAPYDAEGVSGRLVALGWEQHGPRWRRPMLESAEHRGQLWLAVGPRLSLDRHFIRTDAAPLIHLNLLDRVLAQSVDLLHGAGGRWHLWQKLDRLESLLFRQQVPIDLQALLTRARALRVQSDLAAAARLLQTIGGAAYATLDTIARTESRWIAAIAAPLRALPWSVSR